MNKTYETGAPIRETDKEHEVTWRGFLKEMPYDRDGMHATGYEVVIDGEYWNEYFNEETKDFEYKR